MSVVINGTSGYIADFSNATIASRQAFQTSTTNGSTGIYALPNGTSTAASWQATNAADPTNASKILIATNGSTDVQLVSGINGTGTYLPLTLYTNGAEKMRLDTSGNLGLGVTPSAWGSQWKALQINTGASLYGSSTYTIVGQNIVGQSSTDNYISTGYASRYRQSSGTHIWDIAPSGTAGNTITFTQAMTLDASGVLTVPNGVKPYQLIGSAVANNISWDGAQFFPQSDNTNSNGYPGKRWTVIYATTGTINTSDANQKQDISSLDDAEKRVAVAIKSLIKKYRFKDAVAEKGDAARIHIGAVAQEVQAAFVSEGLEPSRYALFCSNTWYEVNGKISEDLVNAPYTAQTEGAVEVTQLGLRYDELLAFVIAAL
jgi:hypothetical protein